MDLLPLPLHREITARLLAVWQQHRSGLPGGAIAEALRAAAYCIQKQPGAPELVWTGPEGHASVRRTDQALLQLIRAAERELLLVTFAAYKVPEIVLALQEAVGRGVRVGFVAETVEESGGKVSFDATQALGEPFASQVEVFVWPLDKRSKGEHGQHGSLHAKCAVADRAIAFISSANLTGFALNLNMEVGVLVRGGSLPAALADQFDRLVQRKVLLRLELKKTSG